MDAIAPGVATFLYPRVEPGALLGVSDTLAERLVYGDPSLVAARARWLLAAESAGYAEVAELCEALADPSPQRALQSVSGRAFERFVASINREAIHQSDGAFDGSMECSGDSFEATLQIDSPQVVKVESLHTTPTPVAACAYAALDVVTEAFFPALLPVDLLSSWHADNIREDLRGLRKKGVPLDPYKVLEEIEKNPDAFEAIAYHHPNYDFETVVEMFVNEPARPAWMRAPRGRTGLRGRLRMLSRRLSRLMRSHRVHPWARYAQDVLDAAHSIPAILRNDNARRAAWDEGRIESGHSYLGEGVAIYSGNPIEGYVLDTIYTQMEEAGELPGFTFRAEALADPAFRAMLVGIGTGFRLLMQASQTNSLVSTKKTTRTGK